MTIDKIIELVYQKIDEDKTFSKKLIEDPRKAIFDLTGESLPKELEVEVIESKKDDLHFVLM